MIIECLSLLKSHSIFNIYVSTKCVIIRPRQELQFFAVLFVAFTPLLQIQSIFGLTSPELFLNTKRDLFYSYGDPAILGTDYLYSSASDPPEIEQFESLLFQLQTLSLVFQISLNDWKIHAKFPTK